MSKELHTVAMAACVAACAAAWLPSQTMWSASAHAAAIHVVGEHAVELRGERELELPAGDYQVHFGTDAAGKPQSLQFACDDGDTVRIAIARALPAAGRDVPVEGDGWQTKDLASSPLPTHVRVTGDADAGDYRIVATVLASGDEGTFGLIARRTDDDHRYRLLWDRARHELRLERRLGGDDMVLVRTPMPTLDGGVHTLALQLHGFRLTAYVDDALVLGELDGAFTAGGVGMFWSGPQPTWQRFVIEPVAAPRGSAAITQRRGSATLHGAAVVPPGNLHVLQILLDRPHALLPLTANGMEPWLLEPPAAPSCLMADWRDSLGSGGIGELERGGLFVSELRWPELPALRHQVGMVRALLVSADGVAVTDATPAVPLIF